LTTSDRLSLRAIGPSWAAPTVITRDMGRSLARAIG
jgi:hypothetical protein